MKDEKKTKDELIKELTELRQQIAELKVLRVCQKNENQVQTKEERFFNNVLNCIQDGISILDEDLNIIFVNSVMEKWYAHNMPLVGKKCYEAYHGRQELCEICPSIRTLKNKRQDFDVVPFVGKDGQSGYLDLFTFPYSDFEGKIIGVIEYVRDITNRKLAEEGLLESEEQFRAISHAAGDAIIYMDGNGNIAYWNPSAERIFGYTSQEALGRELHVLIAPEKYHEAYKKGFSAFRTTGKGPAVGKPNEFLAYRKDGTAIPIEVSFSVMHVNGQYHAVGVIRDISERKTAQLALIKSEEKYRDLYDNAPDMYHTLDKDGVIIDCNETEAAMLGYKKEEIIGRHLTDFFTNKSKEFFKKDFPMLNKDKRPLSLEREFVRKDGSVFHSNLNVTSDFDEKGKLLRTKTIARDITRRKQAEEALKESEIKFRSLFENSRDAIYITSKDGFFIDMNQSALDLFGFTREEMLGNNILKLYVNPEDRTRFQQEIEQKGYAKDYEVNFRKKNGDEITCLLTSTCRENLDGCISGYQGIFRDITEKKKMEDELSKVEKLESLGILAGGIAHDFNNILTTIMGNLSLALMNLKQEDQNFQKLMDAEKASLRARDLTHQLLTFSRGGAPIRKAASITELIRESSGFALRGSNVRCEINIPENVWPVKIDEGQISQVIHNLVINADQAMSEGGVIEITAVNTTIKKNNELKLPEGKYVKTTIRDHGVGIPEGYLKKIFDPYFTTKQQGSGLGLAISFSIVKRHDGYIIVEPGSKSGTSFHVYLPASEKQAITRRSDAKRTVKGNGRILVMDDDESIREVIGYMLEKIGCEAGFAKDGKEAIELYRKAAESGDHFDAVIIDLTIPGGMGGKETIQELLKIDPDVRAIVSSGYSNDPVMAEFDKYGFKAVIAKPYKTSQLSKVLHKVLAKH